MRGLGVSSESETPQRCGESHGGALRRCITEVFGLFLIPAGVTVPAPLSERGHQEHDVPFVSLAEFFVH